MNSAFDGVGRITWEDTALSMVNHRIRQNFPGGDGSRFLGARGNITWRVRCGPFFFVMSKKAADAGKVPPSQVVSGWLP
jgi:hypothetical protein